MLPNNPLLLPNSLQRLLLRFRLEPANDNDIHPADFIALGLVPLVGPRPHASDEFFREIIADGVAGLAFVNAVFARPVARVGAGVENGFVGEDAACGGEEEEEEERG